MIIELKQWDSCEAGDVDRVVTFVGQNIETYFILPFKSASTFDISPTICRLSMRGNAHWVACLFLPSQLHSQKGRCTFRFPVSGLHSRVSDFHWG